MPKQEADQRQQVAEPEDLAVLDHEAARWTPASTNRRQPPIAAPSTPRSRLGLRALMLGARIRSGVGWLPPARRRGLLLVQPSSSADRSLTTTVRSHLGVAKAAQLCAQAGIRARRRSRSDRSASDVRARRPA